VLVWTHGPHPRQEAAFDAPERCIWCKERTEAMGADAPPLYRPTVPPVQAGAAPTASAPSAADPLCSPKPYTATDVRRDLEDGLKRAGEAVAPVLDRYVETVVAPVIDALARFEELAEAFRRETGMLAPGKDQPAAMNGSPSLEERAERWRLWCAARAAAARPQPKPKGQLSLL
jgi:hypothetical protein